MNWKGELCQILTFVVAPTLGVLGVAWALRAAAPARWTARRFAWITAATFLVTRVGAHLVVFHVFRYAGCDDLLRVWAPMGRAVLAGSDPGAYADNFYGPLFPCFAAIGLAPSGGRYAPGADLAFVAADAATLWLVGRAARRRLPETTSRRLVLAVALSPLLWLGVTALSQDEALSAFFLLLVLDFADRGRGLAAAATAALGALCTKALFPLWALPVLLASSRGRRTTIRDVGAAAAFTAVGFAAAHLLGWRVAPEADRRAEAYGASSWRLVLPDGVVSAGAFRVGLAATAVLCVVAAVAATRPRAGDSATDSAARGVVAVQAVFFVVSPFTIGLHLVHGLPFLAWQVVREGGAERRTTPVAAALLAGFAAWQIPSLAVEASDWPKFPPLIVAFVAFWGWTGWRAVTAPWPAALPEAPR
jgi:hypothetical protein